MVIQIILSVQTTLCLPLFRSRKSIMDSRPILILRIQWSTTHFENPLRVNSLWLLVQLCYFLKLFLFGISPAVWLSSSSKSYYSGWNQEIYFNYSISHLHNHQTKSDRQNPWYLAFLNPRLHQEDPELPLAPWGRLEAAKLKAIILDLE